MPETYRIPKSASITAAATPIIIALFFFFLSSDFALGFLGFAGAITISCSLSSLLLLITGATRFSSRLGLGSDSAANTLSPTI